MDRNGPNPPTDWRIWESIPDVYARFTARQARVARAGALVLAYALCVAALTREPSFDRALTVDLNAPVADQEIRAAFFFESVDLQRTLEAREAAMAEVPVYYRVDGAVVNEQIRKLRERFALVQQARPDAERRILELLRNSTSGDQETDLINRAITQTLESWRQKDEWKTLSDSDLLAPFLIPDRASLPRRIFEPTQEPTDAQNAVAEDTRPRKTVKLDPDPPAPLTFSDADRLMALAADALEQTLSQGVRPELLPADGDTLRVVIQRGPGKSAEAHRDVAETRLSQINDPKQAMEAFS
ncbi:MAG TPA: hypothetical protein PLO53_14815, partial [Candidatus Hydrogenedentes bacterium]|nr:hypothetical protein [Candidatus Hydrogenedentota bacterium]